MRRIFLESNPNQEFDLNADGRRYKVSLREGSSGLIIASIDIDGERIISGIRCLPNTPLIPYRYVEWGNFIFITRNGEYPQWDKFGKSQRLLYVEREEIEGFINGV